ncbi:MAG: hypothetical protein R3F44_02580 [Candidatus Competibacteraceae bacterium]
MKATDQIDFTCKQGQTFRSSHRRSATPPHARDSSGHFVALLYAASASDLSSFAFVNDDGTLRIRGQTVRLFGIIIPPTDQGCCDNVRPIHCALRAALALENFWRRVQLPCSLRYPGTSLNDDVLASCTVNDEDLAAWLIQRVVAAAAPDAPPEYVVLKKSPGIGVLWCWVSR